MDIGRAIKSLYPQAKESDYKLIDNGGGVAIEVWNSDRLGVLPVIEDLSAELVRLDTLGVSVITKLQLKSELVKRGLWSAFNAALDADPDAKEDFQLASEIDIDYPAVSGLASALSYSQQDLQDLFNEAGK